MILDLERRFGDRQYRVRLLRVAEPIGQDELVAVNIGHLSLDGDNVVACRKRADCDRRDRGHFD